MDANLGTSALMRIARLKNSQAKNCPKKNGEKKYSGFVENYMTIGLRSSRSGVAEVFIDFTGKSSDMRKTNSDL